MTLPPSTWFSLGLGLEIPSFLLRHIPHIQKIIISWEICNRVSNLSYRQEVIIFRMEVKEGGFTEELYG
jgi:hypothetical protein